MTAIRCTQKLLKQAGLSKPPELPETDEDWHANLVWIDRRKHVLFCSDRTLFVCLTPSVRKSEIVAMAELFAKSLWRAMDHHGYSGAQIEAFLEALGSVQLTRTSSRSVLGSMTDYVIMLEHRLAQTGGFREQELDAYVHDLNRTPQVKRKLFPWRAFGEWVDEVTA